MTPLVSPQQAQEKASLVGGDERRHLRNIPCSRTESKYFLTVRFQMPRMSLTPQHERHDAQTRTPTGSDSTARHHGPSRRRRFRHRRRRSARWIGEGPRPERCGTSGEAGSDDAHTDPLESASRRQRQERAAAAIRGLRGRPFCIARRCPANASHCASLLRHRTFRP